MGVMGISKHYKFSIPCTWYIDCINLTQPIIYLENKHCGVVELGERKMNKAWSSWRNLCKKSLPDFITI